MGERLMPTYTYRCPACGLEADAFRSIADRNDQPACPHCGGLGTPVDMVRVITKVSFARSTVQDNPHWDHTLGQVVKNAKDFEQKLEKMNAEQGTHYVPADPTDPNTFGVTEEGMDATNRANTAAGKREKTLWL